MATNQYGQNYSGNDDFRGWLAAGGAGNLSPYALGATGIGPLSSQGTYKWLLSNVGNDGRSGSNQQADAAGQQLYALWNSQRATNPDNANTNNGTSGSGGGGSSSGMTAVQRNAYQAAHDEDNAYLQRLYDTLAGRQGAAESLVDSSYGQKRDALINERNAAFENLDNEQNKIDKQRSKSLNDLGADIRNLLQSANTEMGMYGAGNSSAGQMAAYGASQLQNAQSGDITDQYNEQTGDIGLSRNQYGKKFDDSNNELDIWKNGQMSSIGSDFNDQRNSIQDRMRSNDNTLRQQLAGAGIASPGLSSDIERRTNDVISRYENASAPGVTLSTLPQYTAAGVKNQSVAGQVQGPQLSQAQAMQALTSNKKKDDSGSVPNLY
jgi:hypothetical protein